MLDAVGNGGIAAQAVDLRPAGHAGARDVAGHVVADIVFELLDKMGALRARAHEGHIAHQHIPELGQLIEVPLAEEFADAGAAGVVGGGPDRAGGVFGIHGHGAQLEDGELLAADAAADLAIKHGAGRAALDERRGQQENGRGEHQPHQRAGDVLQPLQHSVPERVKRPRGHTEQGDVANVVHADARS